MTSISPSKSRDASTNNHPATSSGHKIEGAEKLHQIPVWDLPVRIFHWALVVAFAASFITNWLGVNYFVYHLWFGYTTLVLVAFRIVWGVVGSHHAKFKNFIRPPVATAKYAVSLLKGKEKRYVGHNPLGALMVIVLLLALLVQAVTGLFANDEIMNVGPLYGYVTQEFSLSVTGLHKQLFYWILGAIALHVAAVLVHVFVKKENLISAMIKGKKISHQVEKVVVIHASHIWLAGVLLALVILALVWVVGNAPEAVGDFTSY